MSTGEAAFLAGIIRAPNRYSAAEHHLDRAEEARDRVLTQMTEDRYIQWMQVIPGDAKVVHHVLVMAHQKGDRSG